MHHMDFLATLATVLCVAAVTTVAFHALKQPVVLGYVLAGFIVGPNNAIPLVVDASQVETLSELGVILLMFSLGLDFSFKKLMRLGPSAALVTLVEVGFMVWLGFSAARLLGWSIRESVFAGAVCSISSTMIIARAFQAQPVEARLKDLVLGILVFEDLAAIVLLTVLTGLAQGLTLTAHSLLATVGNLGAFLAVFILLGLPTVPRLMKMVVRMQRDETLLVASIGLCFALALLARWAGYSVALGAFLGGVLVAESGAGHQVEKLIQPVRDMFAAIFFVSVGMLIDPRLVAENWATTLLLTAVVVLGKMVGVGLGCFAVGNTISTSIKAGMTLGQIGEFSFIIAALGANTKVTGDFLFPVAVAVSSITTFLTPWLIKQSVPLANYVDRKLPRPLQAFASLYSSWLEQLKSAPASSTPRGTIRRLVRLLALDVTMLVMVVVGSALALGRLMPLLTGALGVQPVVVRGAVVSLAAALSLPGLWGVAVLTRRLARELGNLAYAPPEAGLVDIAASPRRAMEAFLHVAILSVVAVPALALTQPLLPAFGGAAVLVVPLVVLAVMFWRSAANLNGHVRAGAQLVAEVLSRQSTTPGTPDLSSAESMLPGLGSMHGVRLQAGSHAAGQSLRQLNVRGLTGATVIAILRDGEGRLTPTGDELLQQGDVLALIGTDDAVAAAVGLLAGPKSLPALDAGHPGGHAAA